MSSKSRVGFQPMWCMSDGIVFICNELNIQNKLIDVFLFGESIVRRQFDSNGKDTLFCGQSRSFELFLLSPYKKNSKPAGNINQFNATFTKQFLVLKNE